MPPRAAPHRGIDTHYGDGPDDDTSPSKTVLKAEARALQQLGLELSELSADRLAGVAMPDSLREALQAYRRTRSHEGRRRQLQYVGKLMRSADAEPLREAVAAATLGSAHDTWRLHEAERWRAALIADDESLTRWLAEHVDCDGQHLRSLVRAARRDAGDLVEGARQPRSHRELFQFLRPFIAEPT
ncbi:MAG: ribosome biogenesis factor YjgA [Rubrivivax sp.]